MAGRARADRPVGQRAVLAPRARGSRRPPSGPRAAGCGSPRTRAAPRRRDRARRAAGVGRARRAGAERYIEALVSSRAHAGRDIGGALVRRAIEETRAAGIALLRVDCWAGAPPLVAWYERQGFHRSGTFDSAAGTARSSRWTCASRSAAVVAVVQPPHARVEAEERLRRVRGHAGDPGDAPLVVAVERVRPGCGVRGVHCPSEHGYRPLDTPRHNRYSVRRDP